MPRLQRGFDVDDAEEEVRERGRVHIEVKQFNHTFVVGQMLIQVTEETIRLVRMTPNETSYLTGYESRLAKIATAKCRHALSKRK
jgi:hypothetical protein